MKIDIFYSPNFNKEKKRSKKSIKFIVFHYTGMQSERESLARLSDPRSKVSAHYLINRNGKIYRLIQDNQVAWHAGKSCWGKYENLNKNSLGIELVNKGHSFGYTNFSKKQLLSLVKLSKYLIKKYRIKKKYIVGHSDIAPLRKIDPGEKFPWQELAKKKIGIWHNYKKDFLKQFRKTKISKENKLKFFKNINNIGYCTFDKNKLILNKTVIAFQRHYRKELINGLVDQECTIIAKNLSKNV